MCNYIDLLSAFIVGSILESFQYRNLLFATVFGNIWNMHRYSYNIWICASILNFCFLALLGLLKVYIIIHSCFSIIEMVDDWFIVPFDDKGMPWKVNMCRRKRICDVGCRFVLWEANLCYRRRWSLWQMNFMSYDAGMCSRRWMYAVKGEYVVQKVDVFYR